MVCDRCGVREATSNRSTATIDTDGNETQFSEHLCRECVKVERAAFQADAAKTRASLEDGTLFDQIREELSREVTGKGPEEHAKAAEFLDLIRDNIHVPLPQDLVDFANRHRRPPV